MGSMGSQRLVLCTLFVCISSSIIQSLPEKLFQKTEETPISTKQAVDNPPYYVSVSVKSLHDKLYRSVINAILVNGTYFNDNQARARPPFEFKSPEEVRKILDFSLPEKRVDHDTLLQIVNLVIKYSSHASHPYKVDRHGAGLDPYGLVGDWMGTTMSAPVLTYLLAPVFTLMEYEVERQIRTLIYGNGDGDGMVTPGAAAGHGFAIQMALHSKFPKLKKQGFVQSGSPKAVLFLSEQASFTHDKFCIWEGIGLNACIRVKTTKDGRMDLTDLESKIKQAQNRGQTPFLVIGTAGTPVLGAIDPLSKIGQLAKKYGMWFHVDGNTAGANFLSENQKARLAGIEDSDSFLWSADKGLAAPYVTTVLVTKKAKIVHETFEFGSPVVFAPSPIYNNSYWDNGDNTLQTTRRPDILKLWFQWKSKGQKRLAQHIDYTYDMTQQTIAELNSRKNAFELILPNFDSNQVAFYYIPQSLRRHSSLTKYRLMKGAKIAERLKANLLRSGIMTISVNSLPSEKAPFFVMSLGNSALTRADVKYMLDQMEVEGDKLTILEFILEEIIDGRSTLKEAKALLPSEDFSSLKDLVQEKQFPFFPTRRQSTSTTTSTTTTAKTTTQPSRVVKVPTAPSSYPDFVSAPIVEMHGQFMANFFEKVLQWGTYFEQTRQTEPPLLYKAPEDLLSLFDFSLSNTTGTMKDNEQELLTIFQNVIKYSGHLSHPYYNFQLVQALDAYTLMADYLIAALNSPSITFEDNPMLTVMEDELTYSVRKQLGYEKPEQGDGLILPGGSLSCQIAILLAYMKKRPEAKDGGDIATKKSLVAFHSEGAHYGTDKGSYFQGIGIENCVLVDQDERGRMNSTALRLAVEKAKREGKEPFLVVATAGTTVLGSFDPIDEIADVCQEHKMWLHVDGSYGGSSIMSSNTTRKSQQFKGIERSDSFTFNPHKVFGSTRESTCFVTKHADMLTKVAPPPSEQEFNNEELYNGKKYDPGVQNPLTDRRGNVLKMWFMWKAKGLEGLGLHVDHGYNLTAQVYDELLRRQDKFELVPSQKKYGPMCANVNFYYVPKRLRGVNRSSEDFIKQIEPVQRQIIRSTVVNNKMVITNEAAGRFPPSLIISLYNSALTLDDIKYMLDTIDNLGQDL